MTKIKIIDLLNKIANGEDVPKKIKHNGTEHNLNEITGWYQSIDVTGSVNRWFISKYRLNDTVEIIEEDIDIQKIEELPEYKVEDVDCYDCNSIKCNRYAINKLIKAIKQLDKQIKDKE